MLPRSTKVAEDFTWGRTVQIARNYIPQNQPGVVNTAQLTAQYDGADTISGGGPEHYGGGHTCQISLTRQ